ncbi:hypothetical protein BKA61DRAFT_574411 [Leptodontidium sp. MPI-SDFR-AT-0119]|nr:hypothetical protein BKA61DRAFT_574411 [Leptodontidium sp. MPI-SDFR-AT-0119]
MLLFWPAEICEIPFVASLETILIDLKLSQHELYILTNLFNSYEVGAWVIQYGIKGWYALHSELSGETVVLKAIINDLMEERFCATREEKGVQFPLVKVTPIMTTTPPASPAPTRDKHAVLHPHTRSMTSSPPMAYSAASTLYSPSPPTPTPVVQQASASYPAAAEPRANFHHPVPYKDSPDSKYSFEELPEDNINIEGLSTDLEAAIEEM